MKKVFSLHRVTTGNSSKTVRNLSLLVVVLAFVAASMITTLLIKQSAHAAGATIKVTPPSAPFSLQTFINVQGSNFAANESINVYWGYTGPGTGKLKVTLPADATGAFTTHFQTPLAPTGTYTVAAIGKTSGFVATGTSQILPEIYLNPRATGPGSTLYIFGNAFAAHEAVNIYWNYTGPGTGTLMTTATGDVTGSFNTSAKIPTGAVPGFTPIVGVGQSSKTTASFTFILYAPLLSLTPVKGAAGTALTVSAVGFKSFEKVNVYWNNGTTAVGSGTTTENGYLSPLTITVPAGTAPGGYSVKGVGAASGTTIVNNFTVISPDSSLSSASGPVGASVAVSGNGYTPGESVNIVWDYSGPGTGTTLASATAGYSGIVNGSFIVPSAAIKSHSVAIVGTTSKSVTTNSFAVAKSLAVNPASTSPGTSITAAGSGYLPNESVQVYLDSTTGTPLTTVTADANGNINQQIPLATSITPGAHSLIGVGKTSGNSFTAPLTINTNWGDFGFDLPHHRQNSYEFGLGSGNVAGLKLKWSATTSPNLRSSPVYANGIIYVGTTDGKLNAYDAITGALKWQYDTKTLFDIASAPLVDPANNLVVFGTVGYEDSGIPSPFYALDATTGTLKWSVILPWNNFGFPTLALNTIYIGASHEGANAQLTAIDEFSGHINWQLPTTGGVWGAVAVDTKANMLFTGAGNPQDQVLGINATTGALICHYKVPNSGPNGDVGSGVSVANGLVYVDSKDGSIYALQEKNCNPVWTTAVATLHGGNVSSPAISSNGVLYVGSHDANLYALNATTGAVLWKTATGANIDSSPAIVNGVVYIASFDKSIYAVDATSGAVLWHYKMIGMSYTSPIVVNGWLYCGSFDGTVYGFSL